MECLPLDEEKTYLEALVELSEDDLSREIIVPLFEAMGYRTDFHGGVYERGKDIIALRKIPPHNKHHVTVIQTKKIGLSQKTTDSVKIRTLICQLQQCYTDKFPIITGEKVVADCIILCCPEQISSRFLEDINGLVTQNGKEVMPFDGPEIIKNIATHKPSLFNKLLSFKDRLSIKDESSLKNTELFSALNQSIDIDLVKSYSDLSFFVGNVESNFFISSKITITNNSVQLSDRSWKNIKDLNKKIESLARLDLIIESFEETEELYEKQKNIHESKENQDILNNIDNIRDAAASKCQSLNNSLDTFYGIAQAISRYESQRLNYNIAEDKAKNLEVISGKLKSACSIIDIDNELSTRTIEYINKVVELCKNSKSLHKKSASIQKDIKEIYDLKDTVKNHQKDYVPHPKIVATPNKKGIESWWNQSVSSYKESLDRVNSGSNSSREIKKFLSETESNLHVIDLLLSDKNPLKKEFSISVIENRYKDRAQISAYQVFDSGHDIAVYGEAGVGKTTTLQMYARQFINCDDLLLYLPLNRLLSSIKNKADLTTNSEDINGESHIGRYDYKSILYLILIAQNIERSEENVTELDRILKIEKSFQIILDGLDEAYDTIPEILNCINDFKARFAHSQIIISSRDCVSYLSEIEFLGITLLPFTVDQLGNFVNGWLDYEKASKLMSTLEKRRMLDIVKTPLIATILCSLVEKGIEAPSSEHAIYSKRLSLLCGEYDLHKDVERQDLSKDILSLAAQKLAYELHLKQKRSASINELVGYLINNASFTYDKETCEKSVSELLEKCNVLIKDRISGYISFGHFRFQEHLASLEIRENRSINIASLISKDWWKGVLSLYSQTNDIEYLFDELYKSMPKFKQIEETLREMIKQQPIKKINGLNEMLDGYIVADRMDDAIGLDLDEYDSSSFLPNHEQW